MEKVNIDIVSEKFPHYGEEGKALILKAWQIAAEALKEDCAITGIPLWSIR